ncbi:MAG: LysM peptidoglycan-binding domain-containing protein, partial [Candidatus Scalindua sp.]|nr:LysM peptidoglycan-binding domain-containing protein [Candidatus Scalindua sp.]
MRKKSIIVLVIIRFSQGVYVIIFKIFREIGEEMKLDKIFVIFIIVTAFAITGVLHYMRSPEAQKSVPYLITLESSLSVFGEDKSNEFYSFNSQLTPVTEANIIPIDFFVEEQRIIDEYDNEKQIEPILCPAEFTDYISFYMSLTNDMNMYGKVREFKMNDVEPCDTIFCAPHKSIRIVNSNPRLTHRIEANDSLFKLAKRYYNDGSKWTEIYRANRNEMKDPHSLKIGQELF